MESLTVTWQPRAWGQGLRQGPWRSLRCLLLSRGEHDHQSQKWVTRVPYNLGSTLPFTPSSPSVKTSVGKSGVSLRTLHLSMWEAPSPVSLPSSLSGLQRSHLASKPAQKDQRGLPRVQQLGLWASSAGGEGSIPGWATRSICHAVWPLIN